MVFTACGWECGAIVSDGHRVGCALAPDEPDSARSDS